jgi:N-acetylglucosaminyl-diphospho-decaprenol L-rhamnosyltransferase
MTLNPMGRIGVIIVNFRTAPLVIENLFALAAENTRLGGRLKVYVVENDSGDGSASVLAAKISEQGWGDWVHLRPQTKNLGFAGGNNVALAEILACPDDCPFIFFVNPDACVRPGAIEASINLLLDRSEVGIVGSLLINPDGSARRCAFRFPSLMGEFLRGAKTDFLTRLFQRWEIAPLPQKRSYETDWVSGAAFMARRSVFEQIGLLDDHYFLYYEEVDFMHRARRANWTIWHNADSKVVHLAGQATKVKGGQSQDGALPGYWYQSWRRYFVKNHGRWYACLAGGCWLLGELIFRLKLFVQGHKLHPGGVSMRQFWKLSLMPTIKGLE